MSLLSEKTRLPLGAVVGALLAVIPAVGLFSVARADVENLKAEVKDFRIRQLQQDAGMAEVRQDVAVIKKQMEFQSDILREMRDEMKARR